MRSTFLDFSAFLFCMISSSSSLAFYVCGEAKEETAFKTVITCDANGKILKREKFFQRTKTISSSEVFKNDMLILKQNFNSEQELVREHSYEYPNESDFFKVSHQRGVFPKIESSRSLFAGSPLGGEVQKLATWIYKKNEQGVPEHKGINYFFENRIVKRDIHQNGVLKETYTYDQPEVPSKFKHVEGFQAHLPNGELIKSYRPDQSIDPRDYVKSKNLKKILNDQSRRRLVVIDTGFDVSHPALAHKFHLNLKDEIDGLDNDGNGVVDDLVGWNVSDQGEFSNNINEPIAVKIKDKPLEPFSHGAHTASVALEGVDDFSLTAFSGNMSDVGHLNKISELISKEKVEFVNMSFSLGDYKDPAAPKRTSFNALASLIRKNKETLFVAAAGNSEGRDLDAGVLGSREYPASFGFDNILSVGALDKAESDEKKMPRAKPAFFSAVGEQSVDVFAPGHQVKGAAVGGGAVQVSGTSMATPLTLNLILKMAGKFKRLSPISLKQIVLYSAYIPDLNAPFPCTSGGMLFPRRAWELAARLQNSPKKGAGIVKTIALELRKDPIFQLEGESSADSQMKRLAELWSLRGL